MSKFDIYTELKDAGHFEYGSVIERQFLRASFGIDEIDYPAMQNEIDNQSLQELGVTDYIRNQLLNEGKYLKGERKTYRVLLPSENAGQVMSYMTSADNKLKRGIKLNKNTPTEYKINSNDEVRMMMKRQ